MQMKYFTEGIRNKDMKAPSINRAYLASVLPTFAKISLRGAPDTPGNVK